MSLPLNGRDRVLAPGCRDPIVDPAVFGRGYDVNVAHQCIAHTYNYAHNAQAIK
jgi:hypothetical protein